jgi:hypothetical protein
MEEMKEVWKEGSRGGGKEKRREGGGGWGGILRGGKCVVTEMVTKAASGQYKPQYFTYEKDPFSFQLQQ